MKHIFKVAGILIGFIILVQLAVHSWLAKPAPRFPVLSEGRFEAIAHRGGRETAPAGTLAAMKSALKAGADVLEMDISRSSDGHLVIFHDRTLDRATSCSGEIRSKTLSEIQTCDKGRPGYRIPTLEEVFTAFSSRRMIIEIKQAEPSLVGPFCRMVRDYDLQDKLIVGSFRQQALDEFRQTCPEVATSAGPGEAVRFVLAGKIGLSRIITPGYAALQIPPVIPLPGFLPDFPVVTPALVEQAHEKGLAVQVWTINDAARMRDLLAAGVDGIMTDYPSRLVGLKD